MLSIRRTRANRMLNVCSGEIVPGTISALYTASSCLACSGVMSSSSTEPVRKLGSTVFAHCRLRIAPGHVLWVGRHRSVTRYMELGESTVRHRIGSTGTGSQRTRIRLPHSLDHVAVIF